MTPPPLYRQMADRLREQISVSSPGERLTSEPVLAARWGVSRFTVSKAIEELVAEGLVVRKQGSGTFVASAPLRKQPGLLTSFTEAVMAAGHAASHQLLSFDIWPGRGMPPFEIDEPSVIMDRLRYVDGVPVARHNSVVPLTVVKQTGLTEEISRRSDFSFYGFLAEKNSPVVSAKERLNARLATEDERDLLSLPPGAVVIVIYRQSFDEAGQLLDMVEAIYDARRYYYETNLQRNNGPQKKGSSDAETTNDTGSSGGPSLDFDRQRKSATKRRRTSGK